MLCNSGAELQTVVVTVRGQVLDSALFSAAHEAEAFKTSVRRWALERGLLVSIHTQRASLLARAG